MCVGGVCVGEEGSMRKGDFCHCTPGTLHARAAAFMRSANAAASRREEPSAKTLSLALHGACASRLTAGDRPLRPAHAEEKKNERAKGLARYLVQSILDLGPTFIKARRGQTFACCVLVAQQLAYAAACSAVRRDKKQGWPAGVRRGPLAESAVTC